MRESASPDPIQAVPPRGDGAAGEDLPGKGQAAGSRARTRTRWDLIEAALAVVAFVVLCLAVLHTATYMPEPDDHAYQGSVVALADGYPLTLSTAQMDALAAHLSGSGGPAAAGPGTGINGIAQWVRLPNGRWISEKDPGYPFLAVAFQALGVIRGAPLFYGALACLGLFFGARRWLGRFGGALAVGLYCSSGAALLFAWRDYMPTFIDASLVAAGTGTLLWAVLAVEASNRRRGWAGLAGFVALEAAVFARYTDIVVLSCAVLAVVLAWRLRAARLTAPMLACWLGSVAVFGAGLAVFDDLVYGGPLRQGYQPGEITFSLGAIWPNLHSMPPHLIQAIPMLVLGLTALAWIGWRWVRLRRVRQPDAGLSAVARRDAAVGLALAASWLAVWGLYAAYTWTVPSGGSTLQVVRFYVPALGAISLLGAWLITRLPGRAWLAAVASVVVVGAMFGFGVRSFDEMVASRLGGPTIVHGCPPHLAGPARSHCVLGPGPVRGPAPGPGVKLPAVKAPG
ncbi:MAG: hypothetical protein ACRDNF_21385 [Streptosporangiaceae bacterium]